MSFARNSRKAKSLPSASGDVESATPIAFPIVGVGASAGGLEAFTHLLNHLPENTGMAFVLVQHLAPDQPSQLTSLLARTTKMPVLEVENGMVIKPDHVYVISPNTNIALMRGAFSTTPRGNSPVPRSVDHFFSSLAAEQQSWAIGVVLSGTGSDGALGLKAIKEAGGLTFAQDEKSAKFSGMPHQAAADTVDFILPPDQIAVELARIGRAPYLALPQKNQSEVADSAMARNFARILALLRLHTGVDLSQYRDPTIKRRIQRRMVVRTRPTLADYIELLEKDRPEITALFDDVLINVTSFFRDPEMFEALKTTVFPEILKRKAQTIRVWVAGCSTGQEAYSLAITLLEFLEQKTNAPGIQIYATDISESISVEKARRGLYPATIEAQVSPERLHRFFTKEDGGYRISKSIRDLCVFAKQNVTSDPPFSRMDLVSCRNLLIYLTPPLQRHVTSTFHYALNPGGHLVLGNSETVGRNSELFELQDRKHKIYTKKGAAIRPFAHLVAPDLKLRTSIAGQSPSVPASTPGDFQKEADRILLGRYAPAGVLVNSNLEVLQFRGRTRLYLEPPPGEASFNLLKLARGNLSLELGTALREAKKEKAPVQRKIRFEDNDAIRKLNLEIVPVSVSGSADKCFLVLFEDADSKRVSASPPEQKRLAERPIPASHKNRELKQLRAELLAAREDLQAITEQQDAASEELKCANEEALSSNEELQSTNEELGTAKEELQSSNEELHTLNEELQTRNAELTQLNDDLNNLLASVKVPILMLGSDLRVRRFNPAAIELLHLPPAVSGRPLHSLDLPFVVPDLEKQLLEVISKVSPKEMEIRDREGRWLSLRLHPYRTAENRIDGVILELVDIGDIKAAHEKALNYVNAILDTSRAPMLVLTPDLHVDSANEAFYQTFRVPKSETENQLIYELGNHQWDIPELRQLLSQILTQKSVLKDFQVTHDFPQLGRRLMVLNAQRLEQRADVPPLILLSIEDITERKHVEQNLRDSLEREKAARQAADDANRAKDDFLAALSHELRTPLNPVLLIASDCVEDQDLPSVVRENFEIVRKNIELEARLIDDLLDLTRIACGKLYLNSRKVDVHHILQEAVANTQSALNEKQHKLILRLAAEQSVIAGDPVRLQQVFWNVLKNAVNFTPRGGKIILETSIAHGRLNVKVTDTGIGMSREELERVFGAFSQGDHANSESHRFGGLGLGLAITKKLVEMHSGQIRAESDGLNKGATFTVELPLMPKDEATASLPDDRAGKRNEGKPRAGVRILLVEDHEPTRTVLVHLLERRKYKVFAADSIAQAREIANQQKIDLVISDIGLPDGCGNDLMRDLRERFGLKGIALTGYGMEQDVEHSLAAGFVTHLIKPVRVEELEAGLAALDALVL